NPDPNQGHLVVAATPGGEARVKTYRRDGDSVVLVPANAAYEPMVFAADEVQLYGRVVTVMRKL
ncbi:MAG TPA: S24 family peptidase, partial [Acidimicrobiales bacterium]|nr:S24 family peptidase [Acidimicrobiales bacterium]